MLEYNKPLNLIIAHYKTIPYYFKLFKTKAS